MLFPSTPARARGRPGDPQIKRLKQLGAGPLAQQNYGLRGKPTVVVSAVLVSFGTKAAARDWHRDFATDTGHRDQWKILKAGDTGKASTFARRIGPKANENLFGYELQFAAGNFVGDLSCGDTNGPAPKACESALRHLAQAWYAKLAKSH